MNRFILWLILFVLFATLCGLAMYIGGCDFNQRNADMAFAFGISCVICGLFPLLIAVAPYKFPWEK